jgi:prepilin-type N-terminal cleavage/methylation domain-containing protein
MRKMSKNFEFSKPTEVSYTSGFTLIELILVIGIMAVLATVGFNAFLQYRRQQAFSTAVADVINMLYLVRSRAQSRVAFNRADQLACDPANKRDETSGLLKSWQFDVCRIGGLPTDGDTGHPAQSKCTNYDVDYMISAVCESQNDPPVTTDDVHSQARGKFSTTDIQFIDPSTNSVGFLVYPLTGIEPGAYNPPGNMLVISGYGYQRTIRINADQSISVTNP